MIVTTKVLLNIKELVINEISQVNLVIFIGMGKSSRQTIQGQKRLAKI